MQTHATASGRRGRPRDPDVEQRVLDAAMRIYARDGWAGFTFEAVSRETGIGKPALYRRWHSRGDLLAQTFAARSFVVEHIDTGSLRGDLLELATATLQYLTGPHGRAAFHTLVDVPRYPEVADSTAAYRASILRAARQIVRRAISRRELPPGTSASLVIDMVVGAALNHVVNAPPELLPRVKDQAEAYARTLVDCVVRGLRPEAVCDRTPEEG